MAKDPLNQLEVAKGNTVGLLRDVDDELDSAIIKPRAHTESEELENDAKIAERLNAHDCNSEQIRRTLYKMYARDKLLYKDDDIYMKKVLEKSGYEDPSKDTEVEEWDFMTKPETDEDGIDEHGFKTDSDEREDYLSFSDF